MSYISNAGNARKLAFPVAATVMALGMLVLAPIASALVRPAGATPISASLVLAYDACPFVAVPVTEHNPANLPGNACIPEGPATSTLLTAGEPPLAGAANFRGNLLTKVCGPTSALLCPAPLTSDVLFPSGSPSGNFVVDVRCAAGGAGMTAPVCGNANAAGTNPDYGALAPPPALGKSTAVIRITDINAGPVGGPYTSEGTTTDLSFDVPAICVVTPSTAIGATCLPAVGGANAICGGCVATGKRSNIEVQTLRVQDGGPDAHPFIPDVPNKDYAVQGLFIP